MITLTLPPLSDTKTTKMDPGSSVASDIHVTSDRMVIAYRGFVMPNGHVVSIQTNKKIQIDLIHFRCFAQSSAKDTASGGDILSSKLRSTAPALGSP